MAIYLYLTVPTPVEAEHVEARLLDMGYTLTALNVNVGACAVGPSACLLTLAAAPKPATTGENRDQLGQRVLKEVQEALGKAAWFSLIVQYGEWSTWVVNKTGVDGKAESAPKNALERLGES